MGDLLLHHTSSASWSYFSNLTCKTLKKDSPGRQSKMPAASLIRSLLFSLNDVVVHFQHAKTPLMYSGTANIRIAGGAYRAFLHNLPSHPITATSRKLSRRVILLPKLTNLCCTVSKAAHREELLSKRSWDVLSMQCGQRRCIRFVCPHPGHLHSELTSSRAFPAICLCLFLEWETFFLGTARSTDSHMSPSSDGRLICRPGMPIESEGRSGCESSWAYRVAHREDAMVTGAETRGRMDETLAEASRSCCAAAIVRNIGPCRLRRLSGGRYCRARLWIRWRRISDPVESCGNVGLGGSATRVERQVMQRARLEVQWPLTTKFARHPPLSQRDASAQKLHP